MYCVTANSNVAPCLQALHIQTRTHSNTYSFACIHMHTVIHTHTHYRFLSVMPTPTLFIVFSFLLRTVEGIGTAMYTTVSYTLLTQLYPDKKGTVVVSVL